MLRARGPARRRNHRSASVSGGALASRSGAGDVTQPVDLDEDRSAVDRVAVVVELVAVEPHPAGVGRPVEDANHPKPHRLAELDAGYPSDLEDVTGAG